MKIDSIFSLQRAFSDAWVNREIQALLRLAANKQIQELLLKLAKMRFTLKLHKETWNRIIDIIEEVTGINMDEFKFPDL